MGSLITPGGIATRDLPRQLQDRRPVAHHPWRDRNYCQRAGGTCSSRVAHHPWRDRNTTSSSTPPSSRSRSSPLEGSQHMWIDDEGLYTQVAHHPWRDRNPSSSVATCNPSVAHHPWRDRNADASHRAATAGSLITPGGIATSCGWTRLSPPRVAHHPWRDRNQLFRGRTHATNWSLITPGGIATGDLVGVDHVRTGSLITPGGIATRAACPCGRRPPVAHRPWRDRNMVMLDAARRSTRRSSPLEGSQPVPVLEQDFTVSGVAHHPWRDRNSTAGGEISNAPSVAHHPWRDRN